MNRKGFTLIELLGVIVIIGLVVGLSSYGIISTYNNSKGKALILTNESIKKAAVDYSEEKSNDVNYWKKNNNNSYFCVTIIELINKGFLKKDKIDKTRYNEYVSVIKNDITKVIDDTILLSEVNNNDIYNICNDNVINENVTKPEIKAVNSYTDEIEYEFIDAKVESTITERKCTYRDLNGIVVETIPENNKCNISRLKSNTTYYELKACSITSKGTVICSDPTNEQTWNLVKPTININNTVEINYNDSNIKGKAGHYFKSTLNGNSTQDVIKCTLNNNKFTCDGSSTNMVEKDNWYKINANKVNISYGESGQGKVTARITDKSNNYNENSKDISIYKVTFSKGLADKIDGQVTDVTYNCLVEKNSNCKIKSPSFERSGYSPIGWNEDANVHESSWNTEVEKQINRDITYYPITSKKITITFNGNGVDNQTRSCTMYNSDTSCNITSPVASRNGYTFIGWGTSNTATSSSWNGNTSNNVNSDTTYYAIWKANKPTITSIDNSSDGNWSSSKVTLTVNVNSVSNIQYVTYSYDQNNWLTKNMTTPKSVNGNNYVFEAKWSAERDDTVYFKAVDVYGNESDIKTTTVRIDKTAPKLYVTIFEGKDDNKKSLKKCDSSEGVTECEITKSIPTDNNTIKVSVKDIGDVISGVNTSVTRKYNPSNNMTSYDESSFRTNHFTVSYYDSSDNYRAYISIGEPGYRVLYITAKDIAGNETTMKLKIPVDVCGISNPAACDVMYFCREGQTKVHEAPYANQSGNVTEKGKSYINAAWAAKFHSSVHVVKNTVKNNNDNYFYLVCFDNDNYLNSISANNSVYRGAFAQGADGYFFENGIISFSGINSPKQCGYVYHKCLAPDITTVCSSAECQH